MVSRDSWWHLSSYLVTYSFYLLPDADISIVLVGARQTPANHVGKDFDTSGYLQEFSWCTVLEEGLKIEKSFVDL